MLRVTASGPTEHLADLRGTTMNVYAGAERVTSGASAPAVAPG